MKVLITGASGLIGGRLSNYLASKGFKVVKASEKKIFPLKLIGIQIVKLDVSART